MAPLGWATRSMGRHGQQHLFGLESPPTSPYFLGTMPPYATFIICVSGTRRQKPVLKFINDLLMTCLGMPLKAIPEDVKVHWTLDDEGFIWPHLLDGCVSPESPRQKCSRRLPFLGLVCDSAGVPLWPWWYHDVIPATVANKCLSGWYVLGLLSKTNNLRIKMN